MFDWARGSELHRMVQQGTPGAAFDDWLEGWMVARTVELTAALPGPALDVRLQENPAQPGWSELARRPQIQTVPAENLDGIDGHFPLVTCLSFERERSLQSFDFFRPDPFFQMLRRAALRVMPGGVFLWSYLYTFPVQPTKTYRQLEPLAVLTFFERRGFFPFDMSRPGCGRMAIYHDLDTLGVRQQAVLAHADSHHRVVRILTALYRASN